MDLPQAFVIGIFIRTFLYGVYLVLLAHCLRWIFFEDEGGQPRSRINRPLLVVIVVVFLFTTSSLGIWLTLALAAVRGPIEAYNEHLVAAATLENGTTLMVDGMLIFRCWVVSNKTWSAIYFPLFLLLANMGLFVTYIYETATIVFSAIDPPILVAFYSCNIAINLYSTSTIIYRIIRVVWNRHSSGSSDLLEICNIIVQCGLPYLFSTVFYLAATIASKFLLLPTGCALSSTMNAIAFHLLIIRVGLRRDGGNRNNQHISATSFNVAISDLLEDHISASKKTTQEQA